MVPQLIRSLTLLSLLPPGALGAQDVKLNRTLVREVVGDVQEFSFTPDGTRIVYLADQDQDEVYELFSVPSEGGAPVRLNPTLGEDASVEDFAIAPDGSRVVYTSDQETADQLELFSVPTDGSATAVKLNGPLVLGGDIGAGSGKPGFVISPAGIVAYVADQDTEAVAEIYSVPIDGSSAPVKLNSSAPHADVEPARIRFSSDGSRVVWIADHATDQVFELWSAPSDGSSPMIRLSGAPVLNGDVSSFAVSSTGWAVYLGDQDIDEQHELYSTPLDGSLAAVRLNGTLVAGGDVDAFEVVPDGTRVIYQSDQETDSTLEIFSAPIDGSATAVKLSAPFSPGGGSVNGPENAFAISPDSRRVLYRGRQGPISPIVLYTAPEGGGAPAQALTSAVSGRGVLSERIRFTANSERAYFTAQIDPNPAVELFTVPADGSGSPVKVSGTPVAGGHVVEFDVPAASTTVFYRADQDVDGQVELYSTPGDGSGTPVRLNDTLPPDGDVRKLAISSDGARVAFLADSGADELFELSSVTADGSTAPVQLSADPEAGVTLGDVEQFVISPDALQVVYTADQDEDQVREIYSVPISGGQPVRLNPELVEGGNVARNDFHVSPDSRSVVYRSDSIVDERHELFLSPIDGSLTPQRISHFPLRGRIRSGSTRFTPDGSHVVYIAEEPAGVRERLFSVPTDGSSLPTEIGPRPRVVSLVGGFQERPVERPRIVHQYELTHDSTRALFRTDRHLYVTSIDGNGHPLRLNASIRPTGNLLVSPNDLTVVFLGRVGSDKGLYSVPMDGSSTPVLIAPDGLGGVITHDSSHVVHFVNAGFLTFSLSTVAIDGSSAPAPLTSGSAFARRLSPDGAHVVFLALESDEIEIFAAPVDGSAPAWRLNDPLDPGGEIGPGLSTVENAGIEFSPDGTIVYYQGSIGANGPYELFRAPIDGTSSPIVLNDPLPLGGNVSEHHVSGDGTFLVYVADQDVNGTEELYRVPSDGSAPSTKISGPFSSWGATLRAAIAPGDARIVYIAEQDEELAFELYSTF